MIRLYDGWVIDSDDYQFILGKWTPKVIFGKQSHQMDKATYHPTLGSAVTTFYRMQVRELVGQGEMSLSTALIHVTSIEKRIRALMQEPDFKEGLK